MYVQTTYMNHSEAGAGVQHCLVQDPRAKSHGQKWGPQDLNVCLVWLQPRTQTITSYTLIGVGLSHLDIEFQVAHQPPGPKYNAAHSGAASHSITRTDGAGCEASRHKLPQAASRQQK